MRAPCEVHVDAKRTKDGRCSRCESIKRMEYRARNLEAALAYRESYKERERQLARERHAANPDVRRADTRRWKDANPDKIRAKNVEIYHADPETHKARVKAWKDANPGRVNAARAEWCKNNKDKIRATNAKQYAKADKAERLASGRAWQNANREKVRAAVLKWNRANPGMTALRKATKLNATPSWANAFFISEAYHLAKLRTKMLGFAWHVDHIVPLISDSVCGLHCEANLQVIPGRLNSAKGNRHWPDMPTSAAKSTASN